VVKTAVLNVIKQLCGCSDIGHVSDVFKNCWLC